MSQPGFTPLGAPSGGSKGPGVVLRNIPEHLSFIVKIEALSPNFDVQSPKTLKNGWWLPPTKQSAYKTGESWLFRWKGGFMTQLAEDSPVGSVQTRKLQKYSAATVFTQRPDTPHLLAVNFDARTISVSSTEHAWKTLSFNYGRINNTMSTYSSLTLIGKHGQIAAPGPETQIPQLLPEIYNFHPENDSHGRPMPSTRRHAGITGRLALLLALPVFSAPRTALVGILTQCLRPGLWRPHSYKPPSGHERFRGVVVTIYLDPENPEWSSNENLDKLENGDCGPFYGI